MDLSVFFLMMFVYVLALVYLNFRGFIFLNNVADNGHEFAKPHDVHDVVGDDLTN